MQHTEFRPQKIVDALVAANVRFVVIGGVAVIVHGSARVTYDLDISYSRDRANVEALTRALAPFRPRMRGLPDDLPLIWDTHTLSGTTTATLMTSEGDLDLLAEPDGIDTFDGLHARAIRTELFGHIVPVASIDDLISMKRAAGRDKDLQDITVLETIRRLTNPAPNISARDTEP